MYTSATLTDTAEPRVNPSNDFASVETAIVSPASAPLTILTQLTPNHQNSLIEQWVRITNNNELPVPAAQIFVLGLPADVEVVNAQGANGMGTPFVLMSTPLAAGASVDVLIQFPRASGIADFTPTYRVEFLTPEQANALLVGPPAGPPLLALRSVPLPDGAILLEWPSTPGETYFVRYSDDMTTYHTVLPGITARASRT